MSLNVDILYDKIVKKNQNVLISGLAGTGKSYTIKKLYKRLTTDFPELNTFITASTGVASVDLKGQTLHSWGGIGLGDRNSSYYFQHIFKKFPQAVMNYRHTTFLFIDEISLIDPDYFIILNALTKYVRQQNEPFGGIRLILSGDMAQLPAITKNKNIDYIFETDIWKQLNVYRMWLRKIYRQQSDREYTNLLNRIRHGRMTLRDVKLLKGKVIKKMTDMPFEFEDGVVKIQPPLITTHKRKVEKYNNQKLREIATIQDLQLTTFLPKTKVIREELSPMADVDEGNLENKFPVYDIRLCKNAQVMMRCNAFIKMGICNGTVGIVDRIEDKKVFVRFRVDGELLPSMEVPKYKFMLKINGGHIELSQFPLSICYASTIHKAQGTSLDEAVIDVRNLFCEGMAYVALSRVRTLNGLTLLGYFDTRYFKSNPKALKFERDEQLFTLVSACTKDVKVENCAINKVWNESDIADRNVFQVIKEYM